MGSSAWAALPRRNVRMSRTTAPRVLCTYGCSNNKIGGLAMNEHIYTLIIALAGSAGFWSFMALREKNKGNPASEYSTTLKSQIDGLAKRLDAKDLKIEQLLGEIANLRADLSAAKVNILHLETLLRAK